MKLALRTRILFAFGLALSVLGALGVSSWRGTTATIDNLVTTRESGDEVKLLASLLDGLTDADKAARDFIYRGNPALLTRFSAARTRAEASLDSLQVLMRPDAFESAQIAQLTPLVSAKLEFTAATLVARQGPGGERAAFQLITSGRGWQLADAIRQRLTALQSLEDAELAGRSRALAASAASARTILTVSILVTLVIVGLGAAGILREVEARARARRELDANSALLREAYNELRDFYDNAPCGYHSVDAEGLIVRMNDTELQWLGYAREDVIGRKYIAELMTPGDAEGSAMRMSQLLANGSLNDLELNYVRRDGSILPVLTSTTCVRDAQGRFVMTRTVVTDISELRRAQDETVKAVADLAEALASVKTLTGLLPICSMCKSVRDDQGYWATVEQYVSRHTEAQFSHGVCPDCFPKMFPGVDMHSHSAS